MPRSNSSVDQSPMLSPVEDKQPFIVSDSVPFAMQQIEISGDEALPEINPANSPNKETTPNLSPNRDDSPIVIHDNPSSSEGVEEMPYSQQQSSNTQYPESVTFSDSDQSHDNSL